MFARPTTQGGYGKVTTPIEPKIGLYRSGWTSSAYIESIPLLIGSNGRISHTKGGPGDKKIGTAVVPTVPVFAGEEHPRALETQGGIMDFALGTIDDILLKAIEVDKVQGTTTLAINNPTLPAAPEGGMVVNQNSSFIYASADPEWLSDVVNKIQIKVSHLFRQIGGHLARSGYWKLCGYLGTKSRKDNAGLEIVHRPSDMIKLGNEYLISMQPDVDPFTPVQTVYQSIWLYILTYRYRRMLNRMLSVSEAGETIRDGGIITGCTLPDYAADVNMLLWQQTGFGDISPQMVLSGYDIAPLAMQFLGYGFTQANPWPVLNIEDWVEMLAFDLLFGMAIARGIKATAQNVSFYRKHGYMDSVSEEFQRYSRPNIEGFGSTSSPYLIPRHTDMRDIFPIVGVISDAQDDTKRANPWEKVRQGIPMSFSKVDIHHGEVDGTPFDLKEMKETTYLPQTHCDVRLREIDFPLRRVLTAEIPIYGRHVAASIFEDIKDPTLAMERAQRMLSHWLGVKTNTPVVLSDGSWINYRNVLHMGTRVMTYRINELFEKEIELPDGTKRIPSPTSPQVNEETYAKRPGRAAPKKETPATEGITVMPPLKEAFPGAGTQTDAESSKLNVETPTTGKEEDVPPGPPRKEGTPAP